jgi:hypothetical protein
VAKCVAFSAWHFLLHFFRRSRAAGRGNTQIVSGLKWVPCGCYLPDALHVTCTYACWAQRYGALTVDCSRGTGQKHHHAPGGRTNRHCHYRVWSWCETSMRGARGEDALVCSDSNSDSFDAHARHRHASDGGQARRQSPATAWFETAVEEVELPGSPWEDRP